MQRSSVDLPGAGGADDAHDLVLRHRQVDPAQDLELAERFVEPLRPQRVRRPDHRPELHSRPRRAAVDRAATEAA